MPRVPRGGCGTAAASSLFSWAWIGQLQNVTSQAPPSTDTIDFDPTDFFTNDPATFSAGTGTQVYNGILVAQAGVYKVHGISELTRHAAIVHSTKRAWIAMLGYGGASQAGFDFGVPVALNLGDNVAGLDADPQRFFVNNMNLIEWQTTQTFPKGPLSIGVGQDTGGTCSGVHAVYVERISDAIAGPIS